MKDRRSTTLRSVLHNSVHDDVENGREVAKRLGFVESRFIKSCPLDSNEQPSSKGSNLRQTD